ncbi:hypothetical protein MUN88_00470 [Gracilibacillus caseinilyticus]|uniref:Transmembrane secretion effector n=1 Tax=Gracilibacillus caseinilyticus TaxID=2932256 RepID=A0ABY4EXS1_9BACI|nr:hypothetical protein [Gracilibacillus caseinilyticus]UOQ48672.1 hypothetical protein MUN88_00470 [Gracilibacillus caseinilyticus]
MFRKVWRNKHIRFYPRGSGISKFGDVLSGMAFLFLAYDLTKLNSLTTVMAIAETVPYLLFGLIGGVVADWANKKKLLIILDFSAGPIGLVRCMLLLFGSNVLLLLTHRQFSYSEYRLFL